MSDGNWTRNDECSALSSTRGALGRVRSGLKAGREVC